jgi:hypothetical protein
MPSTKTKNTTHHLAMLATRRIVTHAFRHLRPASALGIEVLPQRE